MLQTTKGATGLSDLDSKSNTMDIKPRKVLLILALLLVIVGAVLMVVYRDSIGIALSSGGRSGGDRKPFTYSSASKIEADAMGNGLAIVSNNGMELLDSGGRLAMKEVVAMKNPAVVASSSRAAAFDIGTNNIVVGDLHGNSKSLDLEEDIITATMNDDGWLAVCTEAKGYHGKVTVYNMAQQEVYRWSSGEGYLVTAHVSPDHRYLATLCVTTGGGVVHIMKLDNKNEVAQFKEENALITDIHWLEDDRIFLLEREKCTVIGRDGRAVGSFEFGDKVVTNFAYGEDFAALMLCDYISGKNGGLVTIGPECSVLGQTNVTTGLQAMDANRGSVALLCGDGVYLYTKSLSQAGKAEGDAGVLDVVLRSNADTFLITQNTALIRNF